MSRSSGSRTRFAIPAALAALGLVLLVVGGLLRSSVTLTQLAGGSRIHSSDAGFSIYSTEQADRERAVCTTQADGSTLTLLRPDADFSVEADGTKYWEIARTDDAVQAGDHDVTCREAGAQLFVGNRADTIGNDARLPLLVLGPLLLLAALVSAVLLALRTRRPAPQVPDGYGYQPGHGGPGLYSVTPTPPGGYPMQPGPGGYGAPQGGQGYGPGPAGQLAWDPATRPAPQTGQTHGRWSAGPPDAGSSGQPDPQWHGGQWQQDPQGRQWQDGPDGSARQPGPQQFPERRPGSQSAPQPFGQPGPAGQEAPTAAVGTPETDTRPTETFAAGPAGGDPSDTRADGTGRTAPGAGGSTSIRPGADGPDGDERR